MMIKHAAHPFDFRPMQKLLLQIYKPKIPPDLNGRESHRLNTCAASTALESPPKPSKAFTSVHLNPEKTLPSTVSPVQTTMERKIEQKSQPQISKVIAMKTLSITVSISSLRALMRMFWRQFHVEEIQSTHEEGVFLVLMSSHEDKRRVLEKRMWVMSNFLVLVEDWRRFCEMGKLCFRHAGFKIQLLNLPKAWHNEDEIRNVLRKVGEVCQVSLFMGVPIAWVNMDLRMPFWPAVPVDYKGMKFWVYLAYDNLRNVCYNCGILGHYYKQCKFVKKPFECQFQATHGEFPYDKLCSKMKKYTGVNIMQKSPVLSEKLVDMDFKEPAQCMGGSTPVSGNQNELVDAMDKLCSPRTNVCSGSLPISSGMTGSESVVHETTPENNDAANTATAQREHQGKIERIPDTILRNKLVFGEPFSIQKSLEIFKHATVAFHSGIPGARGVQETMERRSEMCPLSRMILEGPNPISNYFSPQFCGPVANLLLRQNAILNLQVSLVNGTPSVDVKFSCSKSALKKYKRREKTKENNKASTSAQHQEQCDWVAPPPEVKRMKLAHSVDIEKDRQKCGGSESDILTLLKRKEATRHVVFQDEKQQTDSAPEDSRTRNFLQRFQGDAQGEDVATVNGGVQWSGGVLSPDEEIALSALSSGLRVGGPIHPSHLQ